MCVRSGGAGICRGIGFILCWSVGGRGAGFPGIVGYVPAGPFEVETGVGHDLVKSAGAVVTTGKGSVRKPLYLFFNSATLAAFVFINGHLGQSSVN